MTKYKAIIELDENRTTCINCPICDADDNCQLQELSYCDSWEEQLITCPLEKVEIEGIKVGVFESFDSYWEETEEYYKCSNCDTYLFPKQNYCHECGKKLDWESEGE